MQGSGMNLGSFGSVALVAGLCACDATEGPLLVRATGENGSSDAHAAIGPVRADMTVQYQLTGELDTAVDADLFVTDLFDTSEVQLAELHAARRLVMAYVSVGSFESWRDDAAAFPRSAIGEPLEAYPDESWLDTRDAQVRSLMKARFSLAAKKGFDGVFASTLGGYQAKTGFALSRSDQLDYDRFVSATAHALGSSVGLSGDFELSGDLGSEFDWLLAIRCVEQGFCDELAPFRERGLAAFDLEADTGDRAAICAQAATYGLPVVFKRSAFDAFRAVCPGGA